MGVESLSLLEEATPMEVDSSSTKTETIDAPAPPQGDTASTPPQGDTVPMPSQVGAAIAPHHSDPQVTL